jgi:hypothetical protein
VEERSARHQYDQCRTGPQHVGDERGGTEEMLEVIEDESHLTEADRRHQRRGRRLLFWFPGAEGAGDRAGDQLRGILCGPDDVGQLDPGNAIRVVPRDGLSRGDSQTRLANAARSGQRE